MALSSSCVSELAPCASCEPAQKRLLNSQMAFVSSQQLPALRYTERVALSYITAQLGDKPDQPLDDSEPMYIDALCKPHKSRHA